jgi:hypothetical protein
VSFKRITGYRVRTDAFEFLRTFSPVSIIPGSLPAEKERKKERKKEPPNGTGKHCCTLNGGRLVWRGCMVCIGGDALISKVSRTQELLRLLS